MPETWGHFLHSCTTPSATNQHKPSQPVTVSQSPGSISNTPTNLLLHEQKLFENEIQTVHFNMDYRKTALLVLVTFWDSTSFTCALHTTTQCNPNLNHAWSFKSCCCAAAKQKHGSVCILSSEEDDYIMRSLFLWVSEHIRVEYDASKFFLSIHRLAWASADSGDSEKRWLWVMFPFFHTASTQWCKMPNNMTFVMLFNSK